MCVFKYIYIHIHIVTLFLCESAVFAHSSFPIHITVCASRVHAFVYLICVLCARSVSMFNDIALVFNREEDVFVHRASSESHSSTCSSRQTPFSIHNWWAILEDLYMLDVRECARFPWHCVWRGHFNMYCDSCVFIYTLEVKCLVYRIPNSKFSCLSLSTQPLENNWHII